MAISNQHYETDAIIPPGSLIQEALEELGMTQVELAQRMGRPPQMISELVNGRKSLTAETATQLESVIGIPAYILSGLESQYQLALAKRAKRERIETQEIQYLEQIHCYNELVKRGVVNRTSDPIEQVSALLAFFQVASLSTVPSLYQPANRTWAGAELNLFHLAAWLRMGEMRAGAQECKDYSASGLKSALHSLRKLVSRDLVQSWEFLVALMNNAGVRVIAHKPLKGLKVCGSVVWLSRHEPVLIVSDLGRSLDKFWFTFFHEVGHILLHKPNEMFISLEDGAMNPADQRENEADQFAQDLLIPWKAWTEWRWPGRYPTNEHIRQFAQSVELTPDIVAGRLCKEGKMPWSRLNSFRRKLEFPETLAR